jgi:hypothetical protein
MDFVMHPLYHSSGPKVGAEGQAVVELGIFTPSAIFTVGVNERFPVDHGFLLGKT